MKKKRKKCLLFAMSAIKRLKKKEWTSIVIDPNQKETNERDLERERES